jgi:hypothetical protein
MASQPPHHATGLSAAVSDLPQIELVRIHRCGAIFRSNRSYEAGDAVALGLDLSESADSPTDRFIGLEGCVVDCHTVRAGAGMLPYEITLVFAGLSDHLTRLLEAHSCCAPHSDCGQLHCHCRLN